MQADDTNPIWTRARAMFARAVAMLRLRVGGGEQAGLAEAMRLRSFETPATTALSFVAQVAALVGVAPKLRREIVAWLAPLEHVVRKLLIAEAAALHRASHAHAARGVRIEYVPMHRGSAWPPATHCTNARGVGAAAPPVAARSNLDTCHPETWRACFSFALPRVHYVPEAHAPRIRALWGASTPAPELERKPRVFNADSPFRLARRFEALRRVLGDPRPHAERLARALARAAHRVRDIVRRYVISPCRTNSYDPDDSRLGLDAMCAAHRGATVFSDSS